MTFFVPCFFGVIVITSALLVVVCLLMEILCYPFILIDKYTDGIYCVLAIILFPITLLVGIYMAFKDMFEAYCAEYIV